MPNKECEKCDISLVQLAHKDKVSGHMFSESVSRFPLMNVVYNCFGQKLSGYDIFYFNPYRIIEILG